jgi:hypothetical protein
MGLFYCLNIGEWALGGGELYFMYGSICMNGLPGGSELYFIYNSIRMDGLPGGLPLRARARPRNFFLPRGSLEPILVVVTIITSVFGLMYLASVLGLDFVVYVFAWDSHIYINTTVFKKNFHF